jgi:macrophage erythroblast attacher
LDESNRSEQAQVQRCRARLDHLSMLQQLGTKDGHASWNNVRVERILVDYMLRSSYYDTATKLTEANNLQELVDIDIFVDARKVVDALLNKDCSEALAWCAENKSKLKKSKSKLEFKLRLQEFIELVRGDRMIEAIMYARKHLASWGATNMKELQQAMATLAFKSNTDCPGYKILFDAQQWNNLIQQFKQEFYKLYGMTLEPLLHIHLQAGLSALKTPYPHIENCDTLERCNQLLGCDWYKSGSKLHLFSLHVCCTFPLFCPGRQDSYNALMGTGL